MCDLLSEILNLHRAPTDQKGRSEHCGKSGASALQSPGGGCAAAAARPLPFGPQEAKEQPLLERGAP